MENYVGKRLDGRYEISEIIGVGGMAVVYKAYDNQENRLVAIKILKEEFLSNDEFLRRFKNESKAIAMLSHPNIVNVYDVGKEGNIHFLFPPLSLSLEKELKQCCKVRRQKHFLSFCQWFWRWFSPLY